MKRILVLMSGSIAAYKACHVLSRLKQAGHEVEVVASPWALKFIGEATIEGLIGRPVKKAMFGSGAHMAHIDLVRWADLVLVCPATANTINKLAHGNGDDLITTLFLAHDFAKPWLIAPAMNTKMYHHPVTKSSVQKLREMGCEILETASGVLACGEIGDGKLLDPELILAEVTKRLPNQSIDLRPHTNRTVGTENTPGAALSVLITSGGTRVPIDPVRSIANTSTGATGASIANAFLGLGHKVTFLTSEDGVRPDAIELGAIEHFTTRTFVTFDDLARTLKSTLADQSFDVIIHAAAVSDYSIEGGPAVKKMESQSSSSDTDTSNERITLNLVRNPKLIDSIREWSKVKSPDVKLVAFKLANETELQEAVDRLFTRSKSDFVVANSPERLPRWSLIDRDRQVLRESESRDDLGFSLEDVLTGRMQL